MLSFFIKRNCENGYHKWDYYKRKTTKFVYYLRKCDDCGVDQIQQRGGTGDGSWRNVEEKFVFGWEKEEFDKSVIEEV